MENIDGHSTHQPELEHLTIDELKQLVWEALRAVPDKSICYTDPEYLNTLIAVLTVVTDQTLTAIERYEKTRDPSDEREARQWAYFYGALVDDLKMTKSSLHGRIHSIGINGM